MRAWLLLVVILLAGCGKPVDDPPEVRTAPISQTAYDAAVIAARANRSSGIRQCQHEHTQIERVECEDRVEGEFDGALAKAQRDFKP